MGDTIKRCSEHLQNFTLMDNTCLKTSTLSMQAMGLFAYLMTLPNDWVIYKSELVNHFSNGRDAVYKAFNELIENGFITYVEKKNDKNQFQGYEYYIHEKPVEESEKSELKKRSKNNNQNADGKPDTGKPDTGIPYTGNPSLLSTNKQSTDKLNSKSHSFSKAENKKTEKQTFKNTDYQQVYDAYYENCNTLCKQGRFDNPKPVLPVYIKQTIKKAFESYGVDAVVSAVKESINHDWLVNEKNYTFAFIFGKNELPNLINKTYNNFGKSKQQTKSSPGFDKKNLENKYDFDDITIY